MATYRDYELSMVAAERGEHFHLPDPLALERARFTKRLKDKWAEVECLLGISMLIQRLQGSKF